MGQLLAYDATGRVIATLDHLVVHGPAGNVVGLVDFDAHEAAGREHTDTWHVTGAKGSKVWPEYLGGRAHEFRVELSGPAGAKRIVALVHAASGHRRERAAVDAAIAGEPESDGARDLRHVVGGPLRPLKLGPGGD